MKFRFLYPTSVPLYMAFVTFLSSTRSYVWQDHFTSLHSLLMRIQSGRLRCSQSLFFSGCAGLTRSRNLIDFPPEINLVSDQTLTSQFDFQSVVCMTVPRWWSDHASRVNIISSPLFFFFFFLTSSPCDAAAPKADGGRKLFSPGKAV